jgi:hypothetical protein
MNNKWSGLAAIVGGTLFVLATAAWTLTHGIGSTNLYNRLFGLTSRQYAQTLDTALWFCLLLGLFGLNQLRAGQGGRWGQLGFSVAAVGYALAGLGVISQFWIYDPDMFIYSPFVLIGRLISQFAVVLQTVGMLLLGVFVLRHKGIGRWNSLPFLIGLLLVPTYLVQDFIAANQSSRLLYTIGALPYALCWISLGIQLLIQMPQGGDSVLILQGLTERGYAVDVAVDEQEGRD